jgi:hypothetical protein
MTFGFWVISQSQQGYRVLAFQLVSEDPVRSFNLFKPTW